MFPSSEYVIETNDLVKVYKQGNLKAVDGLNLRIKSKEIYALIGANGSGKTTSINMVTGVLSPTSGTVNVLGLDITRYRQVVSRSIGLVPQDYSIYQDLTVEQNIKFFADLYSLSNDEFEERLRELLRILKLEERRSATAANLSGGMKRRVSIACALIHKPKVLFFDEATVGIDPVLRAFFWEYFRSLTEKEMTIVLTSHVMDEAEKADRIGLMRSGKLIEEGTPKDLKERYGSDSIEEVFIRLSGGVPPVD